MSKEFSPVRIIGVSLLFLAASLNTSAQIRNNPYSPSPGATAKKSAVSVPAIEVAKLSDRSENRIINAGATTNTVLPTEIYKIGVGDVIFINLKNTPQGSGYYSVRRDGTIDYPLAGESVSVLDQTVSAIEALFKSRITLFSNPSVEVRVREYASHKVTVVGLVTSPGEKQMQREAVPLFVLRAGAGVNPTATNVSITRGPGLPAETYSLNNPGTDGVLVYPGSTVEFLNLTPVVKGFYLIKGDGQLTGRKDFTGRTTLSQAVSAAGPNDKLKKAVIRRKDANGKSRSVEFELRSLKEGKTSDPEILSGDEIELKK